MFTVEIKYRAWDKSFLLRVTTIDSITTYLHDTDVEWVKNCKGDFILDENGAVKLENIIK